MPSVINSDDGVVSGSAGLKTSGANDGLLDFQSNGTRIAGITTSAFQVGTNNISAVNSLGFRNRIINGAMVIDQRNAGASVTPTTTTNGFPTDRFQVSVSQNSKLTTQQSTVAPTGFSNSLLVTSSSAYSVLSSDVFVIRQSIEGFNFYDLGFGTASAATITLSFWVRSSLTGTFGGSLSNYAATRSYPFSYTISAANTWEQKTVTIAGDTSGTWVGASSSGAASIWFGLGVGATSSGTAGSWSGSDFRSATGATSVVGTNGATFYITGVQLEAGSVATPFERRPYGTELMLCQRYYEKSYNIDVTPGTVTTLGAVYRTLDAGPLFFASPGPILFKVTKRANPTVTLYGTVAGTSGAITVSTDLSAVAVNIGTNGAGAYVNNISAGGAGSGCAAHYVASIEL